MKKHRIGGRRQDYPPQWEEVSAFVRFVRARSRCECTTQCGADHGIRCGNIHGMSIPRRSAASRRLGRARVVLQSAHLCRCRTLCAEEAHLLAMCQACHLAFDRRKHQRNASETRLRKRGQLVLPVMGECFTV